MERSNQTLFDIGLVLAGAVSAGAYTAGVIDFLIEALDAWEKRKEDPKANVPHHDVKLKVMSGASAGAMTAAIAAVALQSEVQPVRWGSEPPPPLKNRLYDAWVRQIDIRRLLSVEDLEKEDMVVSLLNSRDLLSIANDSLVTPERAQPRRYLADPLVVFLTVANLRGVPYGFKLYWDRHDSYRMENHMDEMRFSISPGGCHREEGTVCLDPRRLFVGEGRHPAEEWSLFALAALASGAFPMGLAARPLSRSPSEYKPCCCERIEREPDWGSETPNRYDFLAVDGGLMNNEPLQLARAYLAGGFDQRNPRDGLTANRAVILVDPFPNIAAFDRDYTADDRLIGVAARMFSALVAQARFHALDLELAGDENVYSRFAISPIRYNAQGGALEPAIASASLGGFGGFLKEAFRDHDFHLGRRNCQSFLKRHFCLPEANDLFAMDKDNAEIHQRYSVKDRNGQPISRAVPEPQGRSEPLNKGARQETAEVHGGEQRMLPIIPLVPPLDRELPQREWPGGLTESEFAELKDRISERVKVLGSRLIETELSKLFGDGCVTKAINLAWSTFLAKRASQRVVKCVGDGLTVLR